MRSADQLISWFGGRLWVTDRGEVKGKMIWLASLNYEVLYIEGKSVVSLFPFDHYFLIEFQDHCKRIVDLVCSVKSLVGSGFSLLI